MPAFFVRIENYCYERVVCSDRCDQCMATVSLKGAFGLGVPKLGLQLPMS